jgi:hypothetical protein
MAIMENVAGCWVLVRDINFGLPASEGVTVSVCVVFSHQICNSFFFHRPRNLMHPLDFLFKKE